LFLSLWKPEDVKFSPEVNNEETGYVVVFRKRNVEQNNSVKKVIRLLTEWQR